MGNGAPEGSSEPLGALFAVLRKGRLMKRKDAMTTVGIDLGTSTTKLVVSRLRLANTAGHTRIPRIEIVDRQVVYRSPLYRTPLLNDSLIDMAGVGEILNAEYRRAGITFADIDTGAVIITGETATRDNAREVVMSLADRAGDFVVATAGPDLEGILAGKGSGALEWSKRMNRTVANVDIGGGTANIALFSRGEVRGTCTLAIGGRVIEFERGVVRRVSPVLKKWMQVTDMRLEPGWRVDHSVEMLCRISDRLAGCLAGVLHQRVGPLERELLVGHPPNWVEPPDAWMVSGGVGGMIAALLDGSRSASSCKELVIERAWAEDGFADMGLPLAYSLVHEQSFADLERIPAGETTRATVIGAGTQSMEISGATVHVEAGRLPLRNVPVMAFTYDPEGVPEEDLRQVLARGKQIYDPGGENPPLALAVRGLSGRHFSDLQEAAEVFSRVLGEDLPGGEPAVLIMDGDVGKAFGQCLSAAGLKSLVCIDQIQAGDGDYVDIGEPVMESGAVPVAVKTLVLDGPREVKKR